MCIHLCKFTNTHSRIWMCMWIHAYTFIYVNVHVWIYTNVYIWMCKCEIILNVKLPFDRKKPPPRGGFRVTMFPDQEPGGRGPPSSTWDKFFEGGPLPPGSWSGNIVNRKPPRRGGFVLINLTPSYIYICVNSRIHIHIYECVCVNLRKCIHMNVYVWTYT